MDRLHLLAEEHLALPLPELLLHLRLDLLLGFQEGDLPLHMHEDLPETVLDRERLQEPLLLGDGELDVAGDEIGEAPRLGDGVEHLMHDLLGEAAPLAELRGTLADLLMERDEGGVLLLDGGELLDGDDDRREVALGGVVLERGGALLPLEEELHPAQAPLHLPDAGDHAHRVEDVGVGLLGVVALGDGEDETVALEGGFDGTQGPRPTRRDGGGEAGEDHGAPEREDREGLARAHDRAAGWDGKCVFHIRPLGARSVPCGITTGWRQSLGKAPKWHDDRGQVAGVRDQAPSFAGQDSGP